MMVSALRPPLHAVVALANVPLIQRLAGAELNGAYVFGLGFGLIQALLWSGLGTSLDRRFSASWSIGDRPALRRLAAEGLILAMAAALAQAGVLVAVAVLAVPPSFGPSGRDLIARMLLIQAWSAPFVATGAVLASLIRGAGRYALVPTVDLVVLATHFAMMALGLRAGVGLGTIFAWQAAVLWACLGPGGTWAWPRERVLGFLAAQASLGAIAFVAGYVAFPAGRADLSAVLRRIRGRPQRSSVHEPLSLQQERIRP
jgi:Na+-driven multidrug efflux pump